MNESILKEEYFVKKGTEIKHGKYKQYDLLGNKVECGKFKNGLKVGKWLMFGGEEIVAEEIYYVNGEKEGTYILYHGNGNKMIEGEYLNRLKNGEWKIYNIDGSIFMTEYYETDSLIMRNFVGNDR
ncbi:MAG: hypothetical protein R2730_04720 [Chitinophagales bacterium]